MKPPISTLPVKVLAGDRAGIGNHSCRRPYAYRRKCRPRSRCRRRGRLRRAGRQFAHQLTSIDMNSAGLGDLQRLGTSLLGVRATANQLPTKDCAEAGAATSKPRARSAGSGPMNCIIPLPLCVGEITHQGSMFAVRHFAFLIVLHLLGSAAMTAHKIRRPDHDQPALRPRQGQAAACRPARAGRQFAALGSRCRRKARSPPSCCSATAVRSISKSASAAASISPIGPTCYSSMASSVRSRFSTEWRRR